MREPVADLGAARRAHARARAARARGPRLPRGPLPRPAARRGSRAAPLGDAGGARARRPGARASARCSGVRFRDVLEPEQTLHARARARPRRREPALPRVRGRAHVRLGPRGARAGGARREALSPDPVLRPRRAAARRARVARAATLFRVWSSTTAAGPRRAPSWRSSRASSRSCALHALPENGGKGAALEGRLRARRASSASRTRSSSTPTASTTPTRCRACSRRCRRIPTRSCSASRSSTRARRARGSGRASSRAARCGSRRSRSTIRDPLCGMRGVPLGPALRVLARGKLGTAHGVRARVRGALRVRGHPDRERAGARHLRARRHLALRRRPRLPRDGRDLRAAVAGMLRRAPALLAGRSAP